MFKKALKPIAKQLYGLSPLKPFSEKWLHEVEEYNKKISMSDGEEKDITMYKEIIKILQEKGALILQGIESASQTLVINNALEIDKRALREDKFAIVGKITRNFANLYLQLLTDFTKIEYSFPERWAVDHYAEESGFQNIEQRKQDALKKIANLKMQMFSYDKTHPEEKEQKKNAEKVIGTPVTVATYRP